MTYHNKPLNINKTWTKIDLPKPQIFVLTLNNPIGKKERVYLVIPQPMVDICLMPNNALKGPYHQTFSNICLASYTQLNPTTRS